MNINIVSNDQRYLELNRHLNAAGYSSKICLPSEVESPEILILSVRQEITEGELETALKRLKNGCKVFTGTPETLKKYFNGEIYDYSKNEYFLKENAHLTAEATISYLHNLTGMGVRGKSVFISGYGRIGKALAKIVSCLGGEVFVYARREEVQMEISRDGYSFVPLGLAPNSDIIINTVPSVIFTGELIEKIPNETVIIELASICGFEITQRVNFALGLPGKILPKSAGKVIFDTLKHLF